MMFERKTERTPFQKFRRSAPRGGADDGDVASNVVGLAPNASNMRPTEAFGGAESALRLAKVIAAIGDHAAQVVGITGSRRGVGVSLTSRELAGGLARFGARTLLVDLSGVTLVAVPSEEVRETPSLLSLSVEASPSLFFVDSTAARSLATSPDALSAAIQEAREGGFTVVLDLPPILQKTGVPDPNIAAGGTLCDLVFLVCLSGETDQKELLASIDTSRIVGLKMAGIILNDRRLPASQLLGS